MKRKKIVKKIFVTLLILLLAIQFIPTSRNQSTEILASDFIKTFNPPTDIANKLKVSCYDCHSNNTHYPWYNKVQPIAWFLEHHIEEAKEELNFSEFGNYSKRKQKSKLKSIRDEIKKGKMPLKSYTLMHGDAKFSEKGKKELVKWFNRLRNEIKK